MAAQDPTPISSPHAHNPTPRRRPRFRTLRSRLIASHTAVLLLALALVLVFSAAFLRREERRTQIDQLRDLAVPLLVEARFLTRADRAPVGQRLLAEALAGQAAAIGVRFLVLDPSGTVRFDTGPPTGDRPTGGNTLIGRPLTAYAADIAAIQTEARRAGGIRRRLAAPAPAAIAAGDDPLAGDRLVLAADARAPGTVLGIAAPSQRRPLFGRFLARLLVALAASLAIASLAGYALSRRLAAPVTRLTAAADAMAAGHLEQRVPDAGPDELGRLVTSFNAMSHRVATTARSQRDLLANVAHELRTPLTSVRGYAQALRDNVVAPPADRQRALATIGDEAERMGRLVGDLLDLARLESGQVQLRLAAVDLAPALARVAARFAPEAQTRAVTLTTSAPPHLRARADDGRLAQILDNLVANALRHTPPAGTVTVTATPAPGHTVRLTVRDTGVGIPPDRLDRIFDRFTRADEPPAALTTADRPGFGLGLAIVRELVTAHHGTITVASHPGSGTRFTVDLPMAP